MFQSKNDIIDFNKQKFILEKDHVSISARAHHRTFAENVRYITDSFSNWAKLYIGDCMSKNVENRTNQEQRMRKWNKLLQDHLHC